jgi:hypothetical protein
VQDKARLRALSAWGASALLLTVPSEAALALSNLDMRICLRMWLGLPLVGAGHWCARCGRQVDPHGNHAHACVGNPSVRHNRVRDFLFSLLDGSGFQVTLEQEEPMLRHRPDLRVDHGLAPVLTYLEVHVVHPTAPSAGHARNSESSDAAAIHAWREKLRRDYEPLPERMPFSLTPIVGTTYGSWHPDTRKFLRECAQRVAESAGRLPGAPHIASAVLARWSSSLGIALWRQNVAMLRRCVPSLGGGTLDKPWSEGSCPLWLLPSQPACFEDDAE